MPNFSKSTILSLAELYLVWILTSTTSYHILIQLVYRTIILTINVRAFGKLQEKNFRRICLPECQSHRKSGAATLQVHGRTVRG
jgi:hypothetical protein